MVILKMVVKIKNLMMTKDLVLVLVLVLDLVLVKELDLVLELDWFGNCCYDWSCNCCYDWSCKYWWFWWWFWWSWGCFLAPEPAVALPLFLPVLKPHEFVRKILPELFQGLPLTKCRGYTWPVQAPMPYARTNPPRGFIARDLEVREVLGQVQLGSTSLPELAELYKTTGKCANNILSNCRLRKKSNKYTNM